MISRVLTKRGDTFSLTGTFKQNGVPFSLTGVIVTSQLRKADGTLIENLTYTQLPNIGEFTISATAAQAALWPIEVLLCDIQYVFIDGTKESSETFYIQILQDITA